jgi:hypothetical protein
MLAFAKLEPDFSRWCALALIAYAFLLTHPARSWIASCQTCIHLTRFLSLTAANVYSLLQYLVLGNKLQGVEIGHPPLP